MFLYGFHEVSFYYFCLLQILFNEIEFKSLFTMDCLTKETASGLRYIIANVNKNLRALFLPTQHCDALIIYIISTKLDRVSSREQKTCL